MFDKLKENPAVGKLIAQYDHLPKRDQQALTVLLVALVIAVIYFAIWRPATEFHAAAEASRENAEELLAWMSANRQGIQSLAQSSARGTGNNSQITDGRALMSTVTRSAGESGLSLNRFEPSGDSAIRVWLEDVPFQSVASWIERLNDEFGVVVEQASFDRQDSPGIVTARLTLSI
ncbi:type II secretion system protein GspM [Marinobacter zhejiangensis]|uniref:Type II secretion system protein M n=1 Tax=Marinobacter zhejiangensis TaxID=488535 RepID=A0A1I4PEC1_9GAMM|nr:type II secretion system protein M [Marinobacter zhejiangensis]SFM25935.1 general secretion pathway protein M [Marinobacter zhejiangensis]